MKKKDKLGQLLLKYKIVTEEQLDEAMQKQQETGQTLGRVLVELGMVSEGALTAILARQLGMQYIDLANYDVDITAASLIDAETARKYIAIPIAYNDGKLLISMADPKNIVALDDIRIMTGKDVEVVISTKDDILGAISRYCKSESEMSFDDIEEDEDRHAEKTKEEEEEEDAPIVKYVNLLIAEGVGARASDIHIEPMEKDVRIRFRIDGVLHEVRRSPKRLHAGVSTRIKVMSDLNIAEKRLPQDGRTAMDVRGTPIDLRVASLPTIHGEKIVMRILDKSGALLGLEQLGYDKEPLEVYKKSFIKPYGTILVTGPTGSGKTTALYATLNLLNDVGKNIITVEDPVEYRLPLINQVQVNYKAGLTFAASLRSILRCDPDIVMIGEIRDAESAQIAIESALTGHLVLSTLHTNDAPSSLTRLLEMGIEPFLVASAVDCVSNQRLARKLCERCKEEYEPDTDYLKGLEFPMESIEDIRFFRPKGCAVCNDTGYIGRVGLFEVLEVSEDIEYLVAKNSPAVDIKDQALKEGMVTLREAGFKKVIAGLTSIEEVLRVVM